PGLAARRDRGDGRLGRGGDHLPRGQKRSRQDGRPRGRIQGPLRQSLRRRRARLHRRRDPHERDAQAHLPQPGDAARAETGEPVAQAREHPTLSGRPQKQHAISISLYYHPYSRAAGTLWALEEAGVDYDLKVIDIMKGEQKGPELVSKNPMGKLPTLVDGDVVVTEAAAIALYLADRYQPGKLAPALDDPLRATYL